MLFDLTLATPALWRALVLSVLVSSGAIAVALAAKRLRPVPRRRGVFYGGVVLVALASVAGAFALSDPRLRIGWLLSAAVTVMVGLADERQPLRPWPQLAWQAVIATMAVSSGWTIRYLSHPANAGVIHMDWITVGSVVLPGSVFAVLWLIFLMNAVNWLDGLDGLAPGIGLVALLTLAAISLRPATHDATTLMLAMIGAGATLGFWLWNFPPARVFLGTAGSWWLGLSIGLVAIVGGGKVVTTLLVLALPVADALAVVLQRVRTGQRPWHGDTLHHLHHRLLAAGWSPRGIVVLAVVTTAILGGLAVLLQTREKIIALALAALAVLLAARRGLPRAVPV